MKDFVIDHRARCKYCGGKPAYWCTTSGARYHLIELCNGHGTHEFQEAIKRYRDKEELECFYQHLIRHNSIKGRANFLPFFYKKNRHYHGYCNVLIVCPCLLTTWKFRAFTDNPVVINGKLKQNHIKYGRDKFACPEGANW